MSVTYHNVVNILFTSIVNARKSKLKKEEGVYLPFETDRPASRQQDFQLKEFSFDLLKDESPMLKLRQYCHISPLVSFPTIQTP